MKGVERVNLDDEANADEEVEARGRMMEGTLIPNIVVIVVFVVVDTM